MGFRDESFFSRQSRRFPPETTDENLVKAYQLDPDGNSGQHAVTLLLERYRKQVLMWCGRFTRDRENALDLAQEVLLRAYRNLGTYSEQEKFSAWLFIITRNFCLSELRRKKMALAEAGILDFLADPGQGPEEILEEKMVEEDFRFLVCKTLTDQERDAIWMRCFEAMPVDAITHQLGISEISGARSVLQKARRKLRRALKDRKLSREETGS